MDLVRAADHQQGLVEASGCRRPRGAYPEHRKPDLPNVGTCAAARWCFFFSAPNAGFYRMDLGAAGRRSPNRMAGPAPNRRLLGPGTMSVSADGRTILYTSEELTAGDIYALSPGKVETR